MEVEEGSQEWDSRYYHAYMEGQELFDSRIAASAYRDSPSATTRLTRPSRIHTHLTHPPRTFTSLSIYLCTPRNAISVRFTNRGLAPVTARIMNVWAQATTVEDQDGKDRERTPCWPKGLDNYLDSG